MLLLTMAAILSALVYLVVLGYALLRTGRAESSTAYWLTFYTISSVATAGLLAVEGLELKILDSAPGLWLALASLTGMCLLGALTFSYLNLKLPWLWLLAALLLGGLVIVADIYDPRPGLIEHTWRTSLTSLGISAWVAAVLWGAVGLTPVIVTITESSRARLPHYANRGLWWGISLPMIMMGESLAMWAPGFVPAIGLGVRAIGLISLAYGATTQHIADVRGLLRAGVGNAMFIGVTAFVTLLGIGAAFLILDRYPEQGLTLVVVLAIALALLYQALRSLLDQIIKEAVFKTGYDTAAIAADYSKRVAQILDVQELASVIGDTLGQAVEATNLGLLLVTPHSDENIRAEVVVGSGPMPTVGHRFAANSAFIEHLAQTHKPLLQYTLEVADQFKSMLTLDRRWLQRLGADVYVPVMDGDNLNGILAVGPRKGREPYRARDLEMLQAVADQTAVALQNARLVTDLRASNEEIRGLNDQLATRNDQLREMDKVKTDFLTIASHELRTPLTQILGFADLLKLMSEAESIPGEEIAPLTESVLTASQRLSDVVTQMLEVSQLDVDELQLELVNTSLEKVIQRAAEPFVPALKERRLFLTLKNISTMPILQADPDRLAQALRNIISNAIKFTPDGGAIELRGRLIKQPGQPDMVEIVVADTGIGVASQHLELIFEKFFRVGNTSLHSTSATKFMGAGPGLGLSIARGIVEAHGGRVWAESQGHFQLGQPGTQIHIVLPVKAVGITDKQARAFVGT